MEHVERFWQKVDKSAGPDECWPRLGGRDDSGYGVFYAANRKHKAHRWLLGHLRGAPLVGGQSGVEDACHRCDNPPCVNPAHLYVGTRKRNIADAVGRGRLAQLKRNACPRGHPYDHIRPNGARRCTRCERKAQRRIRRERATHCKNGHPLAGDNILPCRNGTRKCRICDAARASAPRKPRTAA